MNNVLFQYSLEWRAGSLEWKILEQAYTLRNHHAEFIGSSGAMVKQSAIACWEGEGGSVWILGNNDGKRGVVDCLPFTTDAKAYATASLLQQLLREWANHGAFTKTPQYQVQRCLPEYEEPLLPPVFGITTLTTGLVW